MKLTVARHGQTIENLNGIIQGQLDGTLSPLGEQQAQQLARQLRDIPFDVVYCSDLKRCKDTLAPLLSLCTFLHVVYDARLRERNFGNLQGKPTQAIDWSHAPDGVETNQEIYRRVVACVNDILSSYPTGNVLLVTHGGPIRCIKAAIQHVSLEEVFKENPKNASIQEYDIDAPLNIELE